MIGILKFPGAWTFGFGASARQRVGTQPRPGMNSWAPLFVRQPVAAPASSAASKTRNIAFFMPSKLNGIVSRASLLQIGNRIRPMGDSSKYLKGQLLLDGGNLAGSWFHRTVVLICQHDADGAFGLVLNKPSEHKVGDAVVADLPDTLKELSLYVGGPVQPQAMSFLHSDIFLPDANVLPNLNLDHSLDNLVDLAESFSPTQKIRVFAGYAGWSPGQLEDEMKRKAWLTHPASVDLVFNTDPARLWQLILQQKGWQYRLLSDAPENLSWN